MVLAGGFRASIAVAAPADLGSEPEVCQGLCEWGVELLMRDRGCCGG